MKTASFAVCLRHCERDETELTWESPVQLRAIRAFLCEDLVGESPVWVHVDAPGGRRSFLFHPPCGAASRRVSALGLPVELPAQEPLRVWAIRPGGGAVLRVEVDYQSLREKPCGTRQDGPGERSDVLSGV